MPMPGGRCAHCSTFAMHLVQILLPLNRNDGRRQPRALFNEVRAELVERFGGLTAYNRSPAEGVWESGDGTERDDVVILEVMAGELDRNWWKSFRQRAEERFEQESIVVRAIEVVPL
jgi:hypothetical protein